MCRSFYIGEHPGKTFPSTLVEWVRTGEAVYYNQPESYGE